MPNSMLAARGTELIPTLSLPSKGEVGKANEIGHNSLRLMTDRDRAKTEF